MHKLTIGASAAAGATMTALVVAGVHRRNRLAALDTELIQRLDGLNTQVLDNTTALDEIAAKYRLTELEDGADFRRTVDNIASRQLLVGAFMEIRAKETDGAIEGVLTQFEQDYLVFGLAGAYREAARRRRQRKHLAGGATAATEADSPADQ